MNKIKISLFAVVFGILFSNLTLAQEVITNQSIVSLTTAKMTKELIISKIQKSETNFDMTASGVVDLVKNKVNNAVIEEMLYATSVLPDMKNEDVILMSQNKVDKKLIITQINLSNCNFNTNTDGLVELKQAKVHESITAVMLDPSTSVRIGKNANVIPANLVEEHPQNIPAPKDLGTPGIYYENFNAKPVEYVPLESSTSNQTRQGNAGEAWLNSVSHGMTGIGQNIGLTNPNSNLEIIDRRPVFYFQMPADAKDFNDVAEFVTHGVASPNEFVLVRMKQTKKGREVEIGRSSSVINETGFNKGATEFRFKKVSDRLYRVYYDVDLPAGEYAFYYNKGSEQVSSVKLFDFSLKNNISTK